MSVIKVPPEYLNSFLEEGVSGAIRIQTDDGGWELPRDKNSLYRLITSGERSMAIGVGARLGRDSEGVFLHSNHSKRYFGIVRDEAPLMLRECVSEAVPLTKYHDGAQHMLCQGHYNQHGQAGAGNSDALLGALLVELPHLDQEMRKQMLRTTFASLDKDNSGKLSRIEVMDMMRKVMPMSGKQVTEMLSEISDDSLLDFDEWMGWLEEKASEDFQNAMNNSFRTHADCVQAAFRLWDKSGDGMISKKELCTVLRTLNPKMTLDEVKVLFKAMDEDGDGKIDYEEFVKFLFVKK